ncbi:Very-long-chain 3-oxoacyl-CoA reductase-B, partial [Camelus dromedarius]
MKDEDKNQEELDLSEGVVTGATSGIGRAYAHELARRGLNIVLISRDPSKLEHEAKEIERLYGRSTRVIQADFTGGLEIYEPIEAGLKDLEIGILVNNVAKQYADNLGKLLDFEDTAQKLSDIINCNMMSVVQGKTRPSPFLLQMTRIVLPQMVTRRKGIIINISSIVDRNPFPFIAMYGATKAFVRSFSASLKAEYSSEGVLVQTVSPFIVETNMTLAMKNRFLVVNAHDFARQALDTLGLTSYTPGCLRHALQ